MAYHREMSSKQVQQQLLSDWRKLTVAPLLTHSRSHSQVSAAALFPAIRAWTHLDDVALPAFNAVAWPEPWQILEPKAGGFRFPVSVFPRLDDLIGLANRRADHADGVFNAPPGDRCIHQQPYKRQGLISKSWVTLA